MGLRSVIANAVSAAYTALGDIPRAVTYRRTSSVYNTSTGTNVVTNTDYTIAKALLLSFENMEIDKNLILASDRKLLIKAADLPVSSVAIATDYILDGSTVYSILRVTKDPADATIKLQLRAPQ